MNAHDIEKKGKRMNLFVCLSHSYYIEHKINISKCINLKKNGYKNREIFKTIKNYY